MPWRFTDASREIPVKEAPRPPLDTVLLKKEPRLEGAAIAGILFALLGGAAQWLVLGPLSMSDAELSDWLAADPASSATLRLALNLAALASIMFLWFVAVVRRRIGVREDRFFGSVFFGSGLTFLAVWVVGMALIAAPGLSGADAAVVAAAPASLIAGAKALLVIMLPRFQAVFVLSTSTIFLRTGVAPRWLAVVGYLFGAALFVVPVIGYSTALLFQPWVLIVSVSLLLTARLQAD